MQQEPVDPHRLQARVQHYADKAGASPTATQQMLNLLQSPLGQSILQLSTLRDPSLASFLVNDLYKVHMQSMYAQYMTGVTADFALNIRKCPPLTVNTSTSGSSSTNSNSSSRNIAGHVLADVRQRHPNIFSELTERVTQQLQSIEPLSASVLEALQEFNGYTPPKVLLDRLRQHGVAPVEWVDVDGAPIAVGSGPIEAASNTETSVMQAIQAAIIAAAAAEATAAAAGTGTPAANKDKAAALQRGNPTPTPNGTSTDPQPTQPAQPTAAEPQSPSSPSTTAAAATAAAGNIRSSSSTGARQSFGGVVLDRTERLGSSLGRLIWSVEQLNDIPHRASIMLMAGRRSTDLMHLLLQNLYFMQHVTGYVGTSSLLAAAVLRQLLVRAAVAPVERRALVGRVMGTHAHEMTSMVQQLLAGYDAEAGRRCRLQAPVCISQLLAHIVFLTANGGSSKGSSSSSDHKTNTTTTTSTAAPDALHPALGVTTTGRDSRSSGENGSSGNSRSSSRSQFVCGTALPDTFTTPYFLRLAELTEPPAEFLEDMKDKWGVDIQPGTKVFDLFSVWRLDSGSYPDLAQLVYDTWTSRNLARAAAGLAPLPQLQLLHSNISSLDDIRELTKLPAHIRPSMLGFGGLADGFMPFDVTPSDTPTPTLPSHPLKPPSPPTVAAAPAPTAATAAAAAAAAVSQQEVTLPVCSLVMKAVQARLPGHLLTNSTSSSRPVAADAPAGPTPSQPTTPSTVPLTAAAAVLASVRQASAVKLGDGGLSKAQTDPRLPPKVRQGVLDDMQVMVQAGGQLVEDHGPLLSEVLREAYVAVVREGVLMDPEAKQL